jgi:hypothetical protein
LSSNVCVGLASEFFASDFQTAILFASFIFLTVLHEPCISFSLVWTIYNNVQDRVRIMTFLVTYFSPVCCSSVIFPLSSLFSNCSFHYVRGFAPV